MFIKINQNTKGWIHSCTSFSIKIPLLGHICSKYVNVLDFFCICILCWSRFILIFFYAYKLHLVNLNMPTIEFPIIQEVDNVCIFVQLLMGINLANVNLQ